MFDDNPKISAGTNIAMLRLRPMDALASGGDDRLTIDSATLLNKYYASTFPRAGVIRRGSCTCSTVTSSDYADTCLELDRLATRAGAVTGGNSSMLQRHLDRQFTSIRDRLAIFFGLADTVGGSRNCRPAEIVLFPSGSDAELLATTAALVRSFKLAKAAGEGASKVSVLNCIVAGGEVGSGTANAAQGKHFSAVSPTLSGIGSSGQQQTVGGLVDGITSESVEIRTFNIRDEVTGELRSAKELEAVVTETIWTELSADPLRVCLLHLVCGSKTGVVVPSLEFAINLVTSLKTRGDQDGRVLVVVDCCQLRCHPEYVHRAVTSGFICLVTGSKYYCGPPFSGAVVLPRALADEMEAHVLATGCDDTCMVPAGLCHYLTGIEVSLCVPLPLVTNNPCSLNLLARHRSRWECLSLGHTFPATGLERLLLPLWGATLVYGCAGHVRCEQWSSIPALPPLMLTLSLHCG